MSKKYFVFILIGAISLYFLSEIKMEHKITVKEIKDKIYMNKN